MFLHHHLAITVISEIMLIDIVVGNKVMILLTVGSSTTLISATFDVIGVHPFP